MSRAVLAALLLPALTLLACGDKGDDTGAVGDPDVQAVLELSGDASAGGDVFQTNCSGCHGADGAGVSGPNLNDRVPDLTDAEIVDTVINGVGSMPAIGVTDQEAADVLAYVTTEFGS